MIEIDEDYLTNGNRDLPFWTFEIIDKTNNFFFMQEQLIAYMYGWA